MRFVHGVVSIVSLSLLIGCSSGDRYGPVVLEDDLACRIEIDSSVVLLGDSSIVEAGLGVGVAMNSRGDIVGSGLRVAQLFVWDSTGAFSRTVGRPGEGPGELAPGGLAVYIASGDTVFVRDNHMHWVVYGPDFQFARNASTGPVVGVEPTHTSFLPDGSIVSTMFSGVDTVNTMVRVSRDGKVLEFLGPSHSYPGMNHRPFSPDGIGGYWVGPAPGPAAGYSLERWSADGVVVDTVVRDVQWFQPDPSYQPRVQRNSHDDKILRSFPFPRVDQVSVDPDGFVWVLLAVPTGPDIRRRYISMPSDSLPRLRRDGLFRRLEVLDPTTGSLIASAHFPYSRYFGFIVGGGSIVYRIEEDGDTGDRTITLLKFALLPAASGVSDVCHLAARHRG